MRWLLICPTLLLLLAEVTKPDQSSGNADFFVFPSEDYDADKGSNATILNDPATSFSTKVADSISKDCVLPELPPGVKSFVDARLYTTMSPGATVSDRQVKMLCLDGYELAWKDSTYGITFCEQGVWAKPFSSCYKTCPVLVDENRDINADRPQQFNVTLPFKCKEFYSYNSSDGSESMTCGPGGHWSPQPPPCKPACGLSSLKPSNKTSARRHAAEWGDFPWHASVYQKVSDGVYDNVCSGVLISVRHVLTGVGCVKMKSCHRCSEVRLDASDLKVTLGKQIRDWSSREKYEVRRSVKEVFYTPIQSGLKATLLLLESNIRLTNKFVIPACILQKNNDFEQIFRSPKANVNNVYVSGWGRGKCYPDSETMPPCPTTEADKLHYAYTGKITYYPFTITAFRGSSADMAVDYGSGLVAKINNTYYVIGIFEAMFGDGVQSYSNMAADKHIDWITDIIRRTSDQPPCTLPEYPHNVYKVAACSGANCYPGPGYKVEDTQVLLISCQPGYHVTSGRTTHTECHRGNWTLTIPKCDNVCPPLVSTTLILECYLGLRRTICSDPQPANTTVRMRCKVHYKITTSANIRHITCLENGTWSRDLPRCEPVCGQSDLIRATHTPTIVGGKAAKTSNFPWNAGIFLKNNGTWSSTVQCGGSLITTQAVLTAAHCVTEVNYIDKPRVFPTSDVAVALGKVNRRWGYMEDSEVNKTVKEIVVHSSYRGSPANYFADIAILILSSEVEATRYISPVCLDLNKNIYRDLTSPSNQGYVMGWGHTVDCPINQCNSPSNTLLYTRTEVLPYHECTNNVQKAPEGSPNLLPRLAADKLCSGNGSESVIQGGDSGGGLVYEFEHKFFIYGVVSNKLRVEKQYSFGLFTNVTQYTDWIADTISSVT